MTRDERLQILGKNLLFPNGDARCPLLIDDLSGPGGNALAIMGTCQRHLRQIGVSQDVIATLIEELKSGDYEHLLDTCEQFFDTHWDRNWRDHED